MSSTEVRKMVLRPPESRMKKDAGMRRVAPINPAIAVRLNISAGLKGKPRFSICTVMIPHIPHTAKPTSRLGMEIQRLRYAIFLPVDSQNFSSSGRQSPISTREVEACVIRGPYLMRDDVLQAKGSGVFPHDFAAPDFGPVHPNQGDPHHAVHQHERA